MKMSTRLAGVLSVSIVALLPQMATAATTATTATTVKLSQVQGDVMVNNGSRFVKATSGLEIKPGAKIVTAKGAAVSLVYQNGCVKQLKQNSMLTVGAAVECTAKANSERVYVAEAVGDTATDAAKPAETALGANSGAPLIGSKFIIGGLVVAGVATAAVVANNNDNNANNASPQ